MARGKSCPNSSLSLCWIKLNQPLYACISYISLNNNTIHAPIQSKRRPCTSIARHSQSRHSSVLRGWAFISTDALYVFCRWLPRSRELWL